MSKLDRWWMLKHLWMPIDEEVPSDEPNTTTWVICSFENGDIPMIGRYITDQDSSGAFYMPSMNRTFLSIDKIVNAWMPLPESYREK